MGRKNKNNKIRILFCGENSHDVTGSCIYVETPYHKILLECGLWQTVGSKLDAYRVNSKRFVFKAKEIDYMFVCHSHLDHFGLAPLAVKRGFSGPIIVPKRSKALAEVLLTDSAHVIASDAEELSKKLNRDYPPFYDDDDVEKTIRQINEYNPGEIVELDEYIKFRFVPSGHIVGGCQLELWLFDGMIMKKILYTSDLGNNHINKDYVYPFEQVDAANIVISECTYGGEPRIATEKTRKKDIEKLVSAITETCVDNNGRVLIPSFAIDRTQTIMTTLYDAFHNKNIGFKILIDSPMAQKVCDAYSNILSGQDLRRWKKVVSWDRFVYVGDYLESKHFREELRCPCVVVASSGFLVGGRAVAWCSEMLPRKNDRIITVGYAPPGSLTYIIKNETQKTITIAGKKRSNKCQITNLTSFSSHMQHDSLIDYLSSISCEKIYLVHGEMDKKIAFSAELENKISEKNKTTRVVCVNKGTEIIL